MKHFFSFMLWAVRVGAVALIFFTLLPLLPVGKWYVRGWDFPRVQLCALMAVIFVLAVVYASLHGWRLELWIVAGCMLLAMAWQGSHVLPFTPLWPKHLASVSGELAGDEKSLTRLGVMNLKFDNDEPEEAARMILALSLDLLLVVEYDEAWASRLAGLKERYPHQAGVVKEKGFGIMLFSREPIESSSVRYLVSDNQPSVWATVKLRQGRRVRFVGVHPKPPGMWNEAKDERHDSRLRDAELLLIAREIADDPDSNWLVAGDLNDVAWSHTTRLFKRVSGLKDMRIGRMMLNSYNSQLWLLRYPLDHVFMSPHFNIASMQRKYIPGSDHFAILADMLLTDGKGHLPTADGEDQEEASEIIQEGKQDARDKDGSS